MKKLNVSVRQMEGRNGPVKNQFIIHTKDGRVFQSYNSVIAFIDNKGQITLDRGTWDYSVTTGKYRNMFLGFGKDETLRRIKSGEIKLADLN